MAVADLATVQEQPLWQRKPLEQTCTLSQSCVGTPTNVVVVTLACSR